jgi:hypothetical protein
VILLNLSALGGTSDADGRYEDPRRQRTVRSKGRCRRNRSDCCGFRDDDQHTVSVCHVTDAAAIIVGASISAIVAMIVVGLQHRLERLASAKDARAERLARFMGASHEIVLGLGDVARAPDAEKKALLTRLEMDQRVRINQALAELRLLEEADVVEDAMRLDRELVRQARLAEKEVWSPEDWRGQRDSLDPLVKAYETTSRAALKFEALPDEITAPPADAQHSPP